jgi:hypothetical protein
MLFHGLENTTEQSMPESPREVFSRETRKTDASSSELNWILQEEAMDFLQISNVAKMAVSAKTAENSAEWQIHVYSVHYGVFHLAQIGEELEFLSGVPYDASQIGIDFAVCSFGVAIFQNEIRGPRYRAADLLRCSEPVLSMCTCTLGFH